MTGKIIKGISGFYYIHCEADDRIYSTRAVGIFRKLGIKPLAGDNVDFEVTDQNKAEGSLLRIHERKNVLIRPAVSNVDQALLVFAVKEPAPSLGLMDRFLISMGAQNVPVIIFFNKADLDDGRLTEKYKLIYENAGYRVICGSTSDKECTDKIKECCLSRTTVLAGPSGVGKSSLTNKLYRDGCMEVGELSRKIKRGKQTTRHTELFMTDRDSYVLDTPGFTSLYLENVESSGLQRYFAEFEPYSSDCRFAGCSHVNEGTDICAVKRAAEENRISQDRYKSYCQIYTELREQEKH